VNCRVCGYKIIENATNHILRRYTCPSLHFRRQIEERELNIFIVDSYEISEKYGMYVTYDFNTFEVISCKLRSYKFLNKNSTFVISAYTVFDSEIDVPLHWAKLNFNNKPEIINKINELMLFC